MMAITTSNSIRVKPLRDRMGVLLQGDALLRSCDGPENGNTKPERRRPAELCRMLAAVVMVKLAEKAGLAELPTMHRRCPPDFRKRLIQIEPGPVGWTFLSVLLAP